MKPIRVALSGSGYRLSAHLGALQAIADSGYEVVEYASTSGGSIVSACLASGMSLAQLKDMCMNLDWAKYMSFSLAPWTFVTQQSFCSGNALLAFLTDLTKGMTFAQCDTDLQIVASDLLTEKEFIFSRGTTPTATLALAARCSASIPFVFTAVPWGDGLFVDGGCCDNIPADNLTVDAIPRVGIYLESDDVALAPNKSYDLKTVAGRVIDLLLSSNELAHINGVVASGAKIIHVPTGFASSFDRNMPVATRQKLYDVGYQTTYQALK